MCRRLLCAFFGAFFVGHVQAAGKPPPRVSIVHVSPGDKDIEKAIAERGRKLEACGARVEHVSGETPAMLENRLSQDLKPSTITLVEGHGIALGNYETKTRFRFIADDVGPQEFGRFRPGRGPDAELEALLQKHSDKVHDPEKVLGLIQKKAGPSVFVDACYGGNCHDRMVCIGTSCHGSEISFNGNAVTARISDLICSAAGDCGEFNAADQNKDGCIDGEELVKTFPDRKERSFEAKEVVITGTESKDEVERRLRKLYRKVEFVTTKELGVRPRITVWFSEVEAERAGELLKDPDPRRWDASDRDWFRTRFPWIVEFQARQFPSAAAAKREWDTLREKNPVQLPMSWEATDRQGKRVFRLIRQDIDYKPQPPKTEFVFKVTETEVPSEADPQKRSTHPLLEGFKFCWAPCREVKKPAESNSGPPTGEH